MPAHPEIELATGESPEMVPSADALRSSWFKRGRRIFGLVSGFLVGQGAAQAVNVVAGLFLVRHLSIPAYAQFGLAMGFQQIFSTLMDFGLAGTIVPIVGDQGHDPAVVGRVVRAAKHLRDRVFYVLAPIAAISFLVVMHPQHWSWSVQAILLISTLIALYSGGKASYYAAPLFLHGKLRAYYLPQVISGTGRLLLYVVLSFAGVLNAAFAAILGALNITFNASMFGQKSSALMVWPDHDDPATEKKLIANVTPSAPAMIFAAFQSQITLLLISLLGGSTIYIAQVAALSRIGQIFGILTTFNLILVEPYIARTTGKNLLGVYLRLSALATLACIPVIAAAFRWPQIVLLAVGPKYADLKVLLGWVIVAACLNYVGQLLWIMNRARRWVFWSGSVLEVGLLVAVQLVYVLTIGVHNTRQAVFLTVVASLCPLIAHTYVSIYGFWRERHPRIAEGQVA